MNIILKLSLLFIGILILSCTKKRYLTNEIPNTIELLSNKDSVLIKSSDTYDLKGKSLIVQGTLKFQNGGKIINGTLIGMNAKIKADKTSHIFQNIKIEGTWDVQEGYINWFSDGFDPILNFRALCCIIEMEAICVLDKLYAIATPIPNEYYNTKKSIKIRGTERHKTGLILNTKHSLSNAYFRSVSGNNISLQNMTLMTEDYSKKIPPKGYDYYFAWSYYSSVDRESKPNMEYFKIESCNILGAITFRYSASTQNTTPSEMLKTGIDTIIVVDSKIDQSVSLIELSNGRYDLTLVKNNEIKNIYGPIFYFPLGDLPSPFSPTELSSLRKSFIFENNRVYNDDLVFSYGEGYMSSFVVKGAEITIEDNVFENLLNDNDKIETVPFYTSALSRTDILNNKVTNCLGRGYSEDVGGSNCFLRIRGSKNVYVKGNKFELNNKGLVKLGLLKSEKSNILEVDKTRFRFSLWSANLNDNDFEAEYVFENNVFSTSFLNEHSIMSRSKILFTNNRIDINYLADLYKENWINSQSIYNGSLILFRDKTFKGNLQFNDNIISVLQSDSPVLSFTKDVNDNKDYDYISYKNNKFIFNGDVSLALPRSKSIESVNRLNGKGSISYNETTTNNPQRTINNLNSTLVTELYNASLNALIHPKFTGTTTIIAENNADTIINVMNIRFQDVYSNVDLKSGPILIDIDALYTLKDKSKVNESYQLVIGDFSNLYFINKSDKIDQTFPFWTIRMPKYRYITSQSDGRLSKFPLVITSTFRDQSIDNNSFLIISNTKDIASFNIKVKIADNKASQRSTSRLLEHAVSKRRN